MEQFSFKKSGCFGCYMQVWFNPFRPHSSGDLSQKKNYRQYAKKKTAGEGKISFIEFSNICKFCQQSSMIGSYTYLVVLHYLHQGVLGDIHTLWYYTIFIKEFCGGQVIYDMLISDALKHIGKWLAFFSLQKTTLFINS